ncbi:MAG TPA: hypothetical protein VK842_09175, partial [bacterium]|nr:hypothetical protein [bacterium]
MRRRILILCMGLGLAAGLAAGSEPPVRESVDLRVVSLNRLELQPQAEPAWGLLPLKSKELPTSVQLYLKPSGQLDSLSRAVQKGAAQIRRAVAPGAKQKDRLRDASLLASALRDWLDINLPVDPSVDWARQSALDQREAWPKASAILANGKADEDGRALAAVALLRSLKVPARVALARGHWCAQYWRALQPVKEKPQPKARKGGKNKGPGAPRPPLGQWCLLDPGLNDWDVDAYSLNAGTLARVAWKPAEELSAWPLGWDRVAFANGDSLSARAAWSASLALGRLSATAQALPLSVAATAALQSVTQGSATLWVLTVQPWRFQVEGALGPLEPVQILTGYRPDLASWGRERRGVVQEMELAAQGIWSDRPEHLRVRGGALADDWSSPPPALGVLHSYRVGLRGHQSVLQAQWLGDQLSGVLLRSDNLSPRSGWTVSATAEGLSAT